MTRIKALLLCLAITEVVMLLSCPEALVSGCKDTSAVELPPSRLREETVLQSSAYKIAYRYLKSHPELFPNDKYITVVDYTKRSACRRMYLIDLKTRRVGRFFVSHGRNSGWSCATRFSNTPGSFKSSKGFFRTGSMRAGKVGPYLELHGLQKGVNDTALSRKLVVHGAEYAQGWTIVVNRGRLGRSQGCFALPSHEAGRVMNRIKNGSLVYVHAE